MSASHLQLIPALRMSAGEIGGQQPDVAIRDWADQGARWIHLVDEDATAGGAIQDRAIVTAHNAAHPRARIELSAGVHDAETFAAAAGTRVDRIVLELKKTTDASWLSTLCAEQGQRVAVSIGVSPHDGSAQGGPLGSNLIDVVRELTHLGCARLIVTNTDHPTFWHHVHPVDAIRPVLQATHRPVLARGRMDHYQELHELSELAPHGLEGVIVDHANSAMDFAEAAAAMAERYDPWEWGPAPA